jgi:pectin methylesterase-like acyl-CoA thioesterase
MRSKMQFLLAMVPLCLLAFGAKEAGAATLTVDDDHVQCPAAAFTSIQAAVNAANPNDKINVCPGTYNEQVSINKSLSIQGIDVGGQNLAVIMPTGVVANSFSLASGNPIAAIVLIDGANKVDLTNLTIDGANNAIAGCVRRQQ